MKNSLSIESVENLLKKAQSILHISPEISLKYALLAEKKASQKEKKDLFGIFNKILGECSLLLEDYDSAGIYIKKADSYYNIHDNPTIKIEIQALLAKWYYKIGDQNKAIEIYNGMIISSNSIGYHNGVIFSFYHMAEVYVQEGSYDEAYQVLQVLTTKELDELSTALKLKILNLRIYVALKCNITTDMRERLQECMILATEQDDSKAFVECYKNNYLYYKLIDNHAEALVNLEKSIAYSKKTSEDDSHNKMSKLLNQYEIDKKEQIIDLIQEKNKKLEDANGVIRKQKLLLETILDTIPNPIYYKTVEGKYLGCNKSWNEMFNRGQASKINRTVYDISTDVDAKKFEENDKELLYKKHLIRFETTMTLADNELHDLVFHKDVFRDEKGSVAGIIGVINDVTDIKNTNKELEKSNEFLSKILDVAPVGICIFNEFGNLNFANKYLREMLLYDGFVKDKTIFDFVEESEVVELKTALINYSEDLPNKGKREVKMLSTQGNILYADVVVSLLSSDPHDRNLFLGILDNITDRKIYDQTLRQSEQKLKRVNSTKDRLFSIIAHDLRGPIGNFREIFRLLASNRKIFSPEEKKSLMEELYKSADYTFDLLENLLQWSRSQRNEVKKVPNYHNVFELVNNIRNEVKSVIESKKITIENKISFTHIGYFDRNMISVVIRNLLTNAVKFSNTGSTITVDSDKVDGWITISIKDHGVGIEESNLAYIFDEEKSFSTPGTANERGTGLGLVLCKTFVLENSGKIWVTSEVGKGSCFYFTVPVENFDKRM
jgi:PAS domain S-box-containing protein